MTFLTDGFHLYEVEGQLRNFGCTGGAFTIVRDCRTDRVREMSDLERAACTEIRT